MKQYDNHFAVAVMICLKEIIFYISSYLNFRVGKYTIFLFSTVGRNIAANGLGICDGTAFENRQPKICTKVDSSTTAQLLPSAPIAAIPC